MEFIPNTLLTSYTTFAIGGPARLFCIVTNEDDLVVAVTRAYAEKLPIFLLGGGSNILVLDQGFPGLVIKNEIRGVVFEEVDEHGKVLVTAGAGENWDVFVKQTVDKDLQGLETLSWIPGTVGAGPVQNIGAYGAEIADSIVSVTVLDLADMSWVTLSKEQCRFAYRDSIFKQEKGRYIIVRVTFGLKKGGAPIISYKDVATYFNQKHILTPTLQEVRGAVIDIRTHKLPDWKTIGTAGSFFKNPIITKAKYDTLAVRYPGMPGYSTADGQIKVPLGWVLEHVCHSRGVRAGKVGTYEKQALVIVADRGASARDVLDFTEKLTRDVYDKTGMRIEREVEVVGQLKGE